MASSEVHTGMQNGRAPAGADLYDIPVTPRVTPRRQQLEIGPVDEQVTLQLTSKQALAPAFTRDVGSMQAAAVLHICTCKANL